MFESIKKLGLMTSDIQTIINGFIKEFIMDGRMKSLVNNGIEVLKNTSQDKKLHDMDEFVSCEILLIEIKKHNFFELLAVMNNTGDSKAIVLRDSNHSDEEIKGNYAHRPYFQEAIKGKTFISEPYISLSSNTYCVTIAVPVINEQGNIVGIIMGDLSLE